MSQDLPAKTLPSRFWMSFTPRYGTSRIRPNNQTVFPGQPLNDLWGLFWGFVLFFQLSAGLLWERWRHSSVQASSWNFVSQKVYRRFSQVSGKLQTHWLCTSVSESGFRVQGASGGFFRFCSWPRSSFHFYFLLSPSRAVTINWSSSSQRNFTWLVWLLWWSPSSWWVRRPPDEAFGQRP